MIYAIFLCMGVMHGQCQMAEPGRQTFQGYVPPTYYETLESCEAKVRQIDPYPRKDMYYRCFGKKVDEWQ